MKKSTETNIKKDAGTNINKDYIPYILSGVLFLAGGIVLYNWLSSYPSWSLQEQLQVYSPLFLEIIFLLIVIAIGLNSRHFVSLWKTIPKKVLATVGVIMIIGAVLVVFVAPRVHRIYYDEDIYENIGQNIAYLKGSKAYSGGGLLENMGSVWKNFIGRAGMCNEGKNEYGEYNCFRLEYNKEPNGWAYILSLTFRLFGVSELAAFLTANLLFVLSIAVVFCIGYLLFKNYRPALYAALLFAFTPEALRWSNTTAVEPSAAFFAAAAVCAVLFFLNYRTTAALFLAVVVTAFGAQFRPESLMIVAVVGLAILFFAPDELKKGRFYLCLAVFFILIIPHIVHLYAVKDSGWGASGPKFSTQFFQGNFVSNFLHYFKNQQYPLLATIFFFLGIVLKNDGENIKDSLYPWKAKAVIAVWFLLFWGIFIYFYAGSYTYGADVRFALVSYIPIALMAGYGAAAVHGYLAKHIKAISPAYVVAGIIIISFLSFVPYVRTVGQEAWAARADHEYAKEMAKALPPDSIILTHNPNMFLVWGKNAGQASLATEQPQYFKNFSRRYPGGIYFHYNFWCNVSDPLQQSFCKNIVERFKSTPIMTFKERDYTYVLYKIEIK